MKFEPIAYASHYGGRCRGCADENGVCPTTGMPCDADQRLMAAAHCLNAWRYGIENGFMDNPFPPAPAEHVIVSKTLDLVKLDCEIDTLREECSKGGIAVIYGHQLDQIAALLDASQPPKGLSKWLGWDQSNLPWSEAKHKDAVCYAAFGETWSMADAAALIGFIDSTWGARSEIIASEVEG